MRGYQRFASKRRKPLRAALPELRSHNEFELSAETRAGAGRSRGRYGERKQPGSEFRSIRTARRRYLFDAWVELRERIRLAAHIALFLDFDGTLAELRPFPSQAALPKPTRSVLSRLAGCSRASVSIISGRTLGDLRNKVRVSGVHYLGLHGWEREGHSDRLSKTILRQINRARVAEHKQLRGLPGVWVEDKKSGFAVHLRAASNAVTRRARVAFQIALKPFLADVRVIQGEETWEVLPHSAPGKGAAARNLLDGLPRFTLPIYAGDDTTDEEAFAELSEGITVHVGKSNKTRAKFWLRNPKEIYRFLQKLEEELLCERLSLSDS